MLKILILIFFISNIFANEEYLIIEENKQLISKEKDISILLKEGYLYYKKLINSKNNSYKLLINEELEDKIELIRYKDIYAIEVGKNQVNITYVLFKKIKEQLLPLNINITNPVFKNKKIFSYYRDKATWFLDIYCDKNKIYKCGEGILYPDNIEKEDIFISKVNNKVEFFTFDAKNEKIKLIEVKSQKNSFIDIIDYKKHGIDEFQLNINNKWINSNKVKIYFKKYKIIKLEKQYLYNQPNKNSKTKMYLIKGDKVEILEEKDDWLYILYKGKKDIKAWIPKSAVQEKEIKKPINNIKNENTLKTKQNTSKIEATQEEKTFFTKFLELFASSIQNKNIMQS
ncbi:SH3 domain-containing protein [Arcobacter sp. LA11]|uniref:SH3 domain-containing protein n=1 Tax=Arcobacter sp. LA11 TaxID=1898176 RepID=UPI000932A8F8|nr:SH3 domain-containing protein [Arcobacter sp. LA11]